MIRIFYAALLLFGWLVGSLLAAPEAEPAVNFLPAPPVIDGVLDAGLRALPARRFPVLDKDDPRNVAPAVTWRVAYGTDFLYLFIEVAADRAIVRDRGYQNGDGFHLVLARPRADGEASDEFYVLGFSAVSDPASFYRQMIWYYNVDLAFRPLDHGTRFEIRSFRGRTGYELLLPWAEVYPYHPWLSEGIGFNLCFVKAEAGGRRTFYALLHDRKIQSEQSPRRYVRLDFQHPALTRGIQSCLVMNRNATAGSIVAVRVATLAAAPGEERIRVRIRSGSTGVSAGMPTRSCCARDRPADNGPPARGLWGGVADPDRTAPGRDRLDRAAGDRPPGTGAPPAGGRQPDLRRQPDHAGIPPG
jgi:hypothetical protein